MVLMEEVEQRVRSPQHLCGRLMTAEPREGKTDRTREKLWDRPHPIAPTPRSDLPDLCWAAMILTVSRHCRWLRPLKNINMTQQVSENLHVKPMTER